MSTTASPFSGDFEDSADVALTYNGDGTIDTIVYTKFVGEGGYFTKTYTFVYDAGKVVSVDCELVNIGEVVGLP